MPLGRVIQVVTRNTGSTALLHMETGDVLLYLDDVTDFAEGTGNKVMIAGVEKTYQARDLVNSTLTLESPLAFDVEPGERVDPVPSHIESWALVREDTLTVTDALWVVVPFAIRGYLNADGLRAAGLGEKVRYEITDNRAQLTDVLGETPILNFGSVPPEIGEGIDEAVTNASEALTAAGIAQTTAESVAGTADAALSAAEAASTIVDAWTYTGTTKIDGGEIEADTVHAGAIDSDTYVGQVITGAVVRTADPGLSSTHAQALVMRNDGSGGIIETYSGGLPGETAGGLNPDIISTIIPAPSLSIYPSKSSEFFRRPAIKMEAMNGALEESDPTAYDRGGRIQLQGDRILLSSTQHITEEATLDLDMYGGRDAWLHSGTTSTISVGPAEDDPDRIQVTVGQITVRTDGGFDVTAASSGLSVSGDIIQYADGDIQLESNTLGILDYVGVLIQTNVDVSFEAVGRIKMTDSKRSGSFNLTDRIDRSTWQTPTYGAGWKEWDIDTDKEVCRFRLIHGDSIEIIGAVRRTGTATGTTSAAAVWTMPSWAIPLKNVRRGGFIHATSVATMWTIGGSNTTTPTDAGKVWIGTSIAAGGGATFGFTYPLGI